MSKKAMLPPFYILINDTDKHHIKYYHDVDFQSVYYESEINNNHYARAIHIRDTTYHIGPRRMKHIETAIKFKDKIADKIKLNQSELKIVLVEKSVRETFKKIRQQELKSFIFEGVFK